TNEPAKPGMNSSGRSMKFSTSLNVVPPAPAWLTTESNPPFPSNETRPVDPPTTTTRSSPPPPTMTSTLVKAIGTRLPAVRIPELGPSSVQTLAKSGATRVSLPKGAPTISVTPAKVPLSDCDPVTVAEPSGLTVTVMPALG